MATNVNQDEIMITIQTETGNRTTMAYRVNKYLAVNHSQGLGGPAWRITHLMTGWALPCAYDNKSDAISMANKLKDLNWNFSSSSSIPKGLKGKSKAIMGDDFIAVGATP